MGAVAAAMQEKGYKVTGSDSNVYAPMSDFLEEKGISIMEGFRPENLPDHADLIVIGNAMTRGNPEVEAVLDRKLPYLSLPETLKFHFLRGRHNLVVTGTHGKTTTSSILAWIFECAGLAPSFLIGGIPNDLGNGCRLGDSKYFILEGDEYDTAFFDKRSKFLHYLPELVIVNNIEFDHADIFQNLDEIKLSFRRLINIVPSSGMILLNADDPSCVEVGKQSPAPILEVGFSPNAANQIRNASQSNGVSRFEIFNEEFSLGMVGEFNIRNAAMAASAARYYGISTEVIRKALESFTGIRRRQELRGEAGGVQVIDDFGHHPTAIRQTLEALRQRQQGGKLWAVFEPRSNTTRRAIFQETLPAAFAQADGVLLAQVARLDQLPPGERLDPERVVRDIAESGRPAFYEATADAIIARLVPLVQPGDVVVIFSNGGFEGIHKKLLAALG